MRRTTPSTMFSLLLVSMLAVPAASAEGVRMNASAQPDGDTGDVSRSIQFLEGLQQKASGELAITSIGDYNFTLDLTTISFQALCVKNFRATSASDVWLEVWASNQIPQVGGDLTHHLVAKYNIGLVSGYATRCVDTGAIPSIPPNPGMYWNSLVLYEGSGSGRTLQFIYTESSKADYGGPFGSKSVYLDKPISYYLTNGGNTASMQTGLRNLGPGITRELMLRLIATEGVPYYGGTINAWTVASKEYAPLAAAPWDQGVDTGSLVATQPPAGTYWITVMLLQKGSDGIWKYYSIYTFSTQYTFTGVSPAPSADFTVTPTTPLVGQSVSFIDTSAGSPTSWSWNFGNGATSTTRNPSYTYSVAGTYNVSLTATNSGGSNTKTKSITVSALSAPVISSFAASPSAVVVGQQTTLTWASTGGTSATIDRGIGSVPTSGSKVITPATGVPYTLTVTGPGGSTTSAVTISAVPSSYAGTWILPSSARASGQNAFWTTDLVLLNTGTDAAAVNIKFLGHGGNGAAGPEQTYNIPARATYSFPDVLSYVFGRESDWGPILIRSSSTTLAVQGQTWTAAPTGGSYGQAVPALESSEFVGYVAKGLAGLRQDSQFRTNIVLANPKEVDVTVTMRLLLRDGTTATTRTVTIGPLGFLQVNLANDLGVTNFAGGSAQIWCSTPGCQVAAYASVIDAATADPRTILAR